MPVVEINTSCNPVWVTIPDGAAETLAATYAAGAAAVDQTMLINAADGGPVIFQANAAATGSLVQAQTSTGTVLFNITDNAAITIAPTTALTLTAAAASTWSTTAGALTITSAAAATWSTSAGALTLTSAAAATWSASVGTLTLQGATSVALQSTDADGATAVAASIDTTVAWSNASASLLDIKTNNVLQFEFRPSGHIYGDTTNPFVQLDDSAGAKIGYGTTVLRASSGLYEFDVSGSTKLELISAVLRPGADLGITLGASGRRYGETWSYRFVTAEKVVTFSATPAFTAVDGEHQQITLTGNITSWTLAAGLAGEVLTIEWIQDGTGSRTLAGTPANVLLAGGAFTLTTTASKRDTLTLRYNTTAASWVEIARAMNM